MAGHGAGLLGAGPAQATVRTVAAAPGIVMPAAGLILSAALGDGLGGACLATVLIAQRPRRSAAAPAPAVDAVVGAEIPATDR